MRLKQLLKLKRQAAMPGTTSAYMPDEAESLLTGPNMLKRLNGFEKEDSGDKNQILYAIDAFIKSVKLKNNAAL